MIDFLVIRLGKDSVPDIKRIDSEHGSPTHAIELQVTCKQVSEEVKPGSYAFLWLGSDNNKGTPTEWKQGLRAFATVMDKSGGPGWNDQCTLTLTVPIIFPESL